MLAGRQYATPRTLGRLQKGIASGRIACKQFVCTELERLDILAGKHYNDSRLWWVIAAASGIGWALQVPPGTRLLIPIKLSDISRIVG